MRPAKLRKPPPQLLHILAIACRRLCHAAWPPALDTTYQPSSTAVTHAYRKLTILSSRVITSRLVVTRSFARMTTSIPQIVVIIRIQRKAMEPLARDEAPLGAASLQREYCWTSQAALDIRGRTKGLTPRTHRAHKSRLISAQAKQNARPAVPLRADRANQWNGPLRLPPGSCASKDFTALVAISFIAGCAIYESFHPGAAALSAALAGRSLASVTSRSGLRSRLVSKIPAGHPELSHHGV